MALLMSFPLSSIGIFKHGFIVIFLSSILPTNAMKVKYSESQATDKRKENAFKGRPAFTLFSSHEYETTNNRLDSRQL